MQISFLFLTQNTLALPRMYLPKLSTGQKKINWDKRRSFYCKRQTNGKKWCGVKGAPGTELDAFGQSSRNGEDSNAFQHFLVSICFFSESRVGVACKNKKRFSGKKNKKKE